MCKRAAICGDLPSRLPYVSNSSRLVLSSWASLALAGRSLPFDSRPAAWLLPSSRAAEASLHACACAYPYVLCARCCLRRRAVRNVRGLPVQGAGSVQSAVHWPGARPTRALLLCRAVPAERLLLLTRSGPHVAARTHTHTHWCAILLLRGAPICGEAAHSCWRMANLCPPAAALPPFRVRRPPSAARQSLGSSWEPARCCTADGATDISAVQASTCVYLPVRPGSCPLPSASSFCSAEAEPALLKVRGC